MLNTPYQTQGAPGIGRTPTEWNRFDICEAWYLFAADWHEGQGTPVGLFGNPAGCSPTFAPVLLVLPTGAEAFRKHLILEQTRRSPSWAARPAILSRLQTTMALQSRSRLGHDDVTSLLGEGGTGVLVARRR
mgnify:CR=1 FL=1